MENQIMEIVYGALSTGLLTIIGIIGNAAVKFINSKHLGVIALDIVRSIEQVSKDLHLSDKIDQAVVKFVQYANNKGLSIDKNEALTLIHSAYHQINVEADKITEVPVDTPVNPEPVQPAIDPNQSVVNLRVSDLQNILAQAKQ